MPASVTDRSSGSRTWKEVPAPRTLSTITSPSTSDHLTGFQLSYDLTPELRASFLTLVDWRGSSASFFPSVVYSPFAWLELTLGVQAFTGPHLSQFGGAEPLGFLLAEAFF